MYMFDPRAKEEGGGYLQERARVGLDKKSMNSRYRKKEEPG